MARIRLLPKPTETQSVHPSNARASNLPITKLDSIRLIPTAQIPKDERVRDALKILDTEPVRTVKELARFFEMSISRLEHLFKAETGMCLRDILGARRLQQAQVLLRARGATTKEIAHASGYAHVSSFARAFKRRFGQTPATYQKAPSHHRRAGNAKQ